MQRIPGLSPRDLGPVPTVTAEELPAEPETTAPAPDARSPKATKASASRKPRPPKSHSSDGGERSIALSVPVDVARAWAAAAANQRISKAQLLLNAVNHAGPVLPSLVERVLAPPELINQGFFVVPAKKATSEPPTGVSIRLASQNVAVLDELAATYGSPSRSHLVTVALRHYLSEVE
jgi:hypothetical protein